MQARAEIPNVPRAVVEWIQTIFPDRLPDVPTDTAAIHMKIGEQRVIRRLMTEVKRQEDNILDT